MQTTTLPAIGLRFSTAAILLLPLSQTARAAEDGWTPPGADNSFGAWHQPTGDWYEAGDAMLNPDQNRLLVGKPGTGVLINGKTGRTNSLVTKEAYQDVQVHVEFMVAKGSNSGVIFHGNYEIQILDSAHVETPTGAHCGGVYPRAEGEPGTPSYRHIDAGSPPRVNAAKPPGQWQTMDVIFQSPRFDEDGNKTANAKFVRVVHNGALVQENHEMPYAHGPNWDRKQFPNGPVVLQGDYGPIAVRNIRVRHWKAGDEGTSAAPKGSRPSELNVPPEGFTALFNGKDLTGWHTRPEVLENWFVEDGVLKSTTLVEHYRASLVSKKHYRDFILMLEFRMPTISDSGICFRRLIPEIPGFGTMEQFNLRSKGGMGHLESYYFLPKETAEKVGLEEEEKPHVRYIDPEVGVWHKVKLTMRGRTFSAEYDGEVLHDNFQFHDWMMNMEPAPILLQKHMVVRGDNLGDENPCPIEYRNVFIKELGPDEGEVEARPGGGAAKSRPGSGDPRRAPGSPLAQLLARIDKNDLPKEYDPAKHQEYVDRRMAELSGEQRGRVGQLWKEKQKLDPDMPNRGFSFVRILTYVAEGESPPAAAGSKEPEPGTDVPDKLRASAVRDPINRWRWSAEADEEGTNRKAVPMKISEELTIYVAPFGVSEGAAPCVVLLPESRLRVRGRVAAVHPVRFGVSINHPNGDFAGRFQTVCAADAFQSGEDFEFTLQLRDLELDPSLAEMKDKLPSAPFHFVVQSAWFHTFDQQAGLEIVEVELTPPSEATSTKKVSANPAAWTGSNWPQFHGPNQDNKSPDTGLLKQWPEGGPALVWKAEGIGYGYSTVSIADGRIFTSGNIGDETVVTALDAADGRILWQTPNGEAWTKSYPGTRGTPTVDGDRVYDESPLGELVCLEAATGKKIWGLNTLDAFQGENIFWGLSESVVIDGDRLICCPGGKSSVVALDKLTGEVVWKADSVGEPPSYATPTLAEYQGLRMIITMSLKSVIGVNADTGELLWQVEFTTLHNENVLQPVYHDGEVFVSGLKTGSVKWRIKVDGQKVSLEEVWRSEEMDNHHDHVILLDGYLYGSTAIRNKGQWICLDWNTGEMRYAAPGVGKGTLTYADGMLYTLGERLVVGLVKPTPTGHEVVSRFELAPQGEAPSWAHPVVCGGRLYLRHGEVLYVYDVLERTGS